MPWDDELRRLSLLVRATFGEDVWEDALTRAMAVMRTSQLADANLDPSMPDIPIPRKTAQIGMVFIDPGKPLVPQSAEAQVGIEIWRQHDTTRPHMSALPDPNRVRGGVGAADRATQGERAETASFSSNQRSEETRQVSLAPCQVMTTIRASAETR